MATKSDAKATTVPGVLIVTPVTKSRKTITKSQMKQRLSTVGFLLFLSGMVLSGAATFMSASAANISVWQMSLLSDTGIGFMVLQHQPLLGMLALLLAFSGMISIAAARLTR